MNNFEKLFLVFSRGIKDMVTTCSCISGVYRDHWKRRIEEGMRENLLNSETVIWVLHTLINELRVTDRMVAPRPPPNLISALARPIRRVKYWTGITFVAV